MNPNDRNELDRQIQEAQADIAASERQKSATKRLAELLGLKAKRQQEQETEAEKKARAVAEALELVHTSGATVDEVIDKLVVAENAAAAARAAFWALSPDSHDSRMSPLSHVLRAALDGYPPGVQHMRYVDYLPSRKGERPRYMDELDARSPAPSPIVRETYQNPVVSPAAAAARSAEVSRDRLDRQLRQEEGRRFYE